MSSQRILEQPNYIHTYIHIHMHLYIHAHKHTVFLHLAPIVEQHYYHALLYLQCLVPFHFTSPCLQILTITSISFIIIVAPYCLATQLRHLCSCSSSKLARRTFSSFPSSVQFDISRLTASSRHLLLFVNIAIPSVHRQTPAFALY